jgi:plasmid stability protein
MPVNLSIKNVPDALADKLRERAERNHRSLQGELMALLEFATSGDANANVYSSALRANAPSAPAYASETAPVTDNLLTRLTAIAGDRGIDTTRRLTRDETHDRAALRKTGA